MRSARNTIIADPRGMVREGLSVFLDAHPEITVVGQAGTGDEAIRLVAELAPDVVLMETALPDMDGESATRRIKAQAPQTRVLILTEELSDAAIRSAFRAGADGHVIKQADADEIHMAIARAVRGFRYLGPELTARVPEVYLGAEACAGEAPGALRLLTHRERELLALVAQGLTSREIGVRLGISPRTANKHKANIMKKLNIQNASALAVFAIRELQAPRGRNPQREEET